MHPSARAWAAAGTALALSAVAGGCGGCGGQVSPGSDAGAGGDGGGPGDSGTSGGAAAPFVNAYCNYLSRCEATLGPVLASEAECRTLLGDFLDCFIGPLTIMGVTVDVLVDSATVDACAAALATAACDQSGPPVLTCDFQNLFAFGGTAAAGQPCDYIAVGCGPGLYCYSDTAAPCSVCRPPGGEGDPCVDTFAACVPGLFCDGATGVCTAPQPDGAPCSDDVGCISGRCAVGGVGTVCTARAGAGSPCGGPADCLPALTCVGGTCGTPVAVGAACTSDDDCGGFHACSATGSVCVNAGPPGSPCGSDDECYASARCDLTSSTCVPTQLCDAAIGEPCQSDLPTACAAGGYCTLVGMENECAPQIPAGMPCTGVDPDECAGGGFCDTLSGTCAGVVAAGAPCAPGDLCAAGTACSSTGICAAGQADGAACAAPADCASFWCDPATMLCAPFPTCP